MTELIVSCFETVENVLSTLSTEVSIFELKTVCDTPPELSTEEETNSSDTMEVDNSAFNPVVENTIGVEIAEDVSDVSDEKNWVCFLLSLLIW